MPAYIFQTLVSTLYKISLCSQVSYFQVYGVVYKQKTPSLFVAQYDSFFLLWPFKAILFSWFCPFLSQFVVVDGSKAMHSVDEIYCVLYDLYIVMIRRMSPLLWLPWITIYFHIGYANILAVFPIGCVELIFSKMWTNFPENVGCCPTK